MIIPPQLGLIPQYFLISKAGLLDTLPGVMVLFFLNPLGIFLMRQYISKSVPDELIEAAKLDGAQILEFIAVLSFRLFFPHLPH